MFDLLLACTLPFASVPDSGSACMRIEEHLFVQAALGSAGAGERYLDSLSSCGGDDPNVLLAIARYHYEQQAYERSQRSLDELLQEPGLSMELRGEVEYGTARNAYQLKQYDRCIAHAHEAARLDYHPAQAYHYAGLAFRRLNDHPSAINEFQQALAVDPSYHPAYECIGYSYSQLRRHDLALANYTKADSMAGHTVASYACGMTRAARDLDRKDQEAFLAERAFRDFPDNKAIILDLINVRDKQERFAEIRPLLALLQAKCSETSDLFGIAKSYESLGQLDSSIYFYRQAIQLDEKDAASHHNLGLIYADLGLFDEAHRHFDRALELDPWNYRLYVAKAGAYNWQHDYQRAYEWSLEYDKHLPNGRRNGLGIGYALMQLGRWSEAVPYLEDALRREPEDDRALNNLGRCHMMLGHMDEALAYFNRAEAAEPLNSFIFHNRAAYYLHAGDTLSACTDLRKALDLQYNWVIDSALIVMARSKCTDIDLDRKILIHEYRGNVKELSAMKFIERLRTEDLLAPLPALAMDTTQKTLSPELAATAELAIAPNPASDQFVLSLGNAIAGEALTLKLFDARGTFIRSERITDPRTVVHVDDLPAARYALVLLDARSVRASATLVVAR